MRTLPALIAAKADAPPFGTRDRSSLARRGAGRICSITAQIAGALMLLVGAVLFAQSFIRAQREDPGYPAENLLIVDLELPRDRYPDRAAVIAFFRQAKERIGRLPGVVAVGGITDFFIRRNADQWVTIEGRTARRETGAPRLAMEGVTPGYFGAVGIELLEGRDFDERDYGAGAADVVIVSQSLARWFWPGESAVGKHLVGGESPPKDGRWSTVVGVVKDIRREGLDVAPILGAFIPAFPRGMDMTIRASTGADDADSHDSSGAPRDRYPPCRSRPCSARAATLRSASADDASKCKCSRSSPRSRCYCRRQASMPCSPTRSRCARARSGFGRRLAPTVKRSSTWFSAGRKADHRWHGRWRGWRSVCRQSDAKPPV